MERRPLAGRGPSAAPGRLNKEAPLPLVVLPHEKSRGQSTAAMQDSMQRKDSVDLFDDAGWVIVRALSC